MSKKGSPNLPKFRKPIPQKPPKIETPKNKYNRKRKHRKEEK